MKRLEPNTLCHTCTRVAVGTSDGKRHCKFHAPQAAPQKHYWPAVDEKKFAACVASIDRLGGIFGDCGVCQFYDGSIEHLWYESARNECVGRRLIAVIRGHDGLVTRLPIPESQEIDFDAPGAPRRTRTALARVAAFMAAACAPPMW